ncbi:transmembrane protein 192-like [Mya arenaria]|uniref:transmembrane protein 192-like n=1 Tax=Mya arenaria TaxID=6604 RepID=UPI0022E08629|nr:transmembrane protein 192-like [Mya arenaria]
MVSLSQDASRGLFFEEHQEDDDLTDSANLSLVMSTEQSGRTINTTWSILLEISLLIGVWVCVFILPKLCTDEKCGVSAYALELFLVAGVWFIQLAIDRYYRNQHYRSRLFGYLNFYRQTRNIRRLPLVVASAALSILLITTQIIMEKCVHQVKCGPLSREGYIQIVVSVSCALQIGLLVIYSIRTIQFNRSGASPDVNQEELMTSFLQTNSISSDIGFRDAGLLDQVLEKQADMIRYLRQHNEQLSRRILTLSEENESLQLRKK